MTSRARVRALLRPTGALALVTAIAAVVSCVSDRTSPVVDTSGCVAPPVAAGTAVVFIRRFAYVPASVHVHAGQGVAWVNCESDGTSHTATADDGTFNSGLLGADGVFVQSFSAVGTTPYHCDLHPFMKAAVIVD